MAKAVAMQKVVPPAAAKQEWVSSAPAGSPTCVQSSCLADAFALALTLPGSTKIHGTGLGFGAGSGTRSVFACPTHSG